MKKISLICFLLLLNCIAFAQVSSTEIYLIDRKVTKDKTTYGIPMNITKHEGYDNQPFFMPDGKKILYVSMPDTTQSDIYEYNIADSTTKRLCASAESEFSPRNAPFAGMITVVRVNKNKAQNFCRFSKYPDEMEVIAEGLDSIGYYCWVNDSVVAFASLNNGMELYIYEMSTNQFINAVKGIGRCLMVDPVSKEVIYTKKTGDKITLYRYNNESGETNIFCEGYKDVEDYVITPDGKLLAGLDGKLFSYDLLKERVWKLEADFTKSTGSFYRMAVSPDGKKLALVSYAGPRP